MNNLPATFNRSLAPVNRLSNLFDDLFDFASNPVTSRYNGWEDHKDEYRLSIDVPGLPQDSIDLTIADSMLSLHAQHNRRFFDYTISVPWGADTSECKANLENGVLTITVPKSESAKPRKIPINQT